MTGQHIQWQGSMPQLRRSDFSLRLAISVRALEESGCQNYEACAAVEAYPVVRTWLGKDKSGTEKRVESIRLRVCQYNRRHAGFVEAWFKIWLNEFRSMRPDAQFWRELLEDARVNLAAVRKEHGSWHPLRAISHCRIGCYLKELGQDSKAKAEFKRALDIVSKELNLAAQHAPLVPTVEFLQTRIRRCEQEG